MTRKYFRNLFCAAAAAVFGAYGPAAQAIVYDIGFDPFDFAGIVRIDLPPGPCFTPNSINSCAFDVLSVDFTDTAGREWDILAPRLGIGDEVSINSDGMLIGIAVVISSLNEVTPHEGNPCGDSSPTLTFTIDSENSSLTHVGFRCGQFSDTGMVTSITQVQVPEPATLALLGLGLSGLALTRRRKPN